jgi:hypothetical protein
MGVSEAQHLNPCGFPFWIQGKQAEPAPEQGRPDRTVRPGFFLPEYGIKAEEEEIVAEQVDCVFRRVLKATVCVLVARVERSLLYS